MQTWRETIGISSMGTKTKASRQQYIFQVQCQGGDRYFLLGTQAPERGGRCFELYDEGVERGGGQ
jgi:hypothetical protein